MLSWHMNLTGTRYGHRVQNMTKELAGDDVRSKNQFWLAIVMVGQFNLSFPSYCVQIRKAKKLAGHAVRSKLILDGHCKILAGNWPVASCYFALCDMGLVPFYSTC